MNKKSLTALNILTLSLSAANLAIGLVLDRKRKDLEKKRRAGQCSGRKDSAGSPRNCKEAARAFPGKKEAA